jgi:hypothetical protein
VPAGPPHPGDSRRPRRPRRDDLAALVTAAITAEERSVAVEAITCAITGNTVRLGPIRRRSPLEIVAILELVADELDAQVRISGRLDTVDVFPPVR